MTMLSVTAETSLVTELVCNPAEGVELGEPVPVDSELDALDSPIGIEEIKTVAECVTVVAASGTAVVTFIDQLVRLVKRLGKPTEVSTENGDMVEITPESTTEDVVEALSSPAP